MVSVRVDGSLSKKWITNWYVLEIFYVQIKSGKAWNCLDWVVQCIGTTWFYIIIWKMLAQKISRKGMSIWAKCHFFILQRPTRNYFKTILTVIFQKSHWNINFQVEYYRFQCKNIAKILLAVIFVHCFQNHSCWHAKLIYVPVSNIQKWIVLKAIYKSNCKQNYLKNIA